jgi:hypothetical protein
MMQIFLVIATLAHLIGTATAMETASHVKTAFEDIDGDATLSRRLRDRQRMVLQRQRFSEPSLLM